LAILGYVGLHATQATKLPPHFSSVLQTFQVTIEIFMRANGQQLDRCLVDHTVRQQTQLISQSKLEYANTYQVTHLGLANLGIACNGLNGCVKVGFLLAVQLFDGSLKSWGDKNPHQPNW
jgi:hypothetical protein